MLVKFPVAPMGKRKSERQQCLWVPRGSTWKGLVACGLEKKVHFKWQKVAAVAFPLNRNQKCKWWLLESAGGLRQLSIFLLKCGDKLHRAWSQTWWWAIRGARTMTQVGLITEKAGIIVMHWSVGTNQWPGHPEGLSNPQKQAAAFLQWRLSKQRHGKGKNKNKNQKYTQGLNPGGHAFTGASSTAATFPSVAWSVANGN